MVCLHLEEVSVSPSVGSALEAPALQRVVRSKCRGARLVEIKMHPANICARAVENLRGKVARLTTSSMCVGADEEHKNIQLKGEKTTHVTRKWPRNGAANSLSVVRFPAFKISPEILCKLLSAARTAIVNIVRRKKEMSEDARWRERI